MKLVIAMIRPEMLAAVQAALPTQHVSLMTVSEVLDCRQQGGTAEIYRGRAVRRPASRLRLEVAVDDLSFATAVDALGQAGDGQVFIIGVDECARSRSCERGLVANGV